MNISSPWVPPLLLLFLVVAVSGQEPPAPPPPAPGGEARPAGRGPGGPMMGQDQKIAKNFDADKNGWLDRKERDAAREKLKADRANRGPGRGGRGGFGPPRGEGEEAVPKAGAKIAKSAVKPVDAKVSLYDAGTLRTVFLDFEAEDWETELGDFSNTDVEVPATMTVDGKTYEKVGVRFRGASSLFTVGPGQKRSLNVSIDFVKNDQRLLGSKTLNLLNCHTDPSLLHTVLYSFIARKYIPSPQANFVRVVINGESWGVYANAQQFDKLFLTETYPGKNGARWKVPGSPRGQGGLDYIGEDAEAYKGIYNLRGGNEKTAWPELIALCKTLTETPIAELEAKLEPILDVEGALRFLALDTVLVNNDGYWVRASDFCIFKEDGGKFYLIPHDMNETLSTGGGMGGPGGGRRPRGDQPPGGTGAPGEPPRPPGEGQGPPAGGAQGGPPGGAQGGPPGGPGGEGARRGGAGGRGATLDPLNGSDDAKKPLRSRLLQVPKYRARYLALVKEIAEKWLDWKTLGPVVADFRRLLEEEVKKDTRKLSSYEDFLFQTSDTVPLAPAEGQPRPRGSLRAFVDQRRAFLLNHAAIKGE